MSVVRLREWRSLGPWFNTALACVSSPLVATEGALAQQPEAPSAPNIVALTRNQERSRFVLVLNVKKK